MNDQKDTGIAYILLVLGGYLGLHRFYLKKIGTGILYLFTGGLFAIGIIYDLITLSSQVQVYNATMTNQAQANQRAQNAGDNQTNQNS